MISEDLENVLAALPELSGWTVSKFEDGSYLVRITGRPVAGNMKLKGYEIEVSAQSNDLDKSMRDATVAALLEVVKYRKKNGVPIGPPKMEPLPTTEQPRPFKRSQGIK